jgi:peptidoglycan/LPS O-acetylase OafA/YrhL
VASQASELHKREIGIISFDCPPDNYSLFLWHEPLQRLLHERGLTLDGSGGFVVNMVVLGVLSGLLSALTYRYVERPALRRKTPAASPSQPTRPASRWRRSTGAAGGVQAIRHAW